MASTLFNSFNTPKSLLKSGLYIAALSAPIFGGMISSVQAEEFEGYCGTATNQVHVSAGRATKEEYVYAKAVGSKDDLGMYFSDSATLKETTEGYFNKVDSCPPKQVKPYEHAAEAVDNEIFNDIGPLNLAVTGGHLLTSLSGTHPQEDEVATTGQVKIPANATIRHAFLYYSGTIAMEGGDFTPDDLQTETDVLNNRISFSINGDDYPLMSPGRDAPAETSSVGSTSHMLAPTTYHWGTLTGVTSTYWTNRLDITNMFKGSYRGDVTVTVNPPEFVDTSANTSTANGGNPAGSSVYNPCYGVSNWSIMVIYEEPEAKTRQLIVRDGVVQAWDYKFIHSGGWRRPMFSFAHEALAGDLEFIAYGTGERGGADLPAQPTCACGCGGLYNVTEGSGGYDDTSKFFSNQHVDPLEVVGDPLNRDKNNGPWKLAQDANTSLVGNDWTLVDSGGKYTEFANLFEGEETFADDDLAVTNENEMTVAGDAYGGHPWAGRGEVSYHGWGSAINVIGVKLDPTAVTQGETSTTIYMKGDQKDVFKPQANTLISYLALLVDVDGGDAAPEITLAGANPVNLLEGTSFVEPGFSALDNEDGDITASVAVACNFNTAETLAAGNYECSYTVTDSADNTSVATRAIIAAANQAPAITLVGNNPLVLAEAATFTDPGATANDPEDGDISASITVTCDFDTATPLTVGSYQCTYSVSDSLGLADSAVRDITVTANLAPTITLVGANPISLVAGTAFTDPGATATDPEDGDISAAITATCNVDTATAGEYSCTYNVKDSKQLAATPVSRAVIVTAAPACTDFTSAVSEHEAAGRAYSTTTTEGQTCWGTFCWGGTEVTTWIATGSDENLGTSGSATVTLKAIEGGFVTGECPADPQPPVIETYAVTTLNYNQAIVTGTASDADGDIDRVVLGLGAVTGITCEGTINFTCTLDYSVHNIEVGAAFGVSLAAWDSRDTVSNVEQFTITRPEQQAEVAPVIENVQYTVSGQNLTVTADITDADGDLEFAVVVRVDDIGGIDCVNSGGDQYTCTVENLPADTYTWKVDAEDIAGNRTSSESFTVTIEEAGSCFTTSNSDHGAANRATLKYNVLYYANGSNDYLGLSGDTISLEETSAGVWTKVTSCP